MYIIENNLILVTVSSLGENWVQYIEKYFDLECLWQGADNKWSSHSTILFPVVGILPNTNIVVLNKNSVIMKIEIYNLGKI